MLDTFTALWTRCHLTGDPTPIYNTLHHHYTEPHRHYHNLQHLSECLAELDSVKTESSHNHLDLNAIEMALWFHDAIYDPHATDNEERSAQLAAQTLTAANAPESLITKITHLILATKTHPLTADPDTALLLDIDLSILGKPPTRYAQYETQIGAEYHWVPQPTFALKRREILTHFLNRHPLYLTPTFQHRYQPQAHKNLTTAIQQLALLPQ